MTAHEIEVQEKIVKYITSLGDDALDTWVFWRIVFQGGEKFFDAEQMTMSDMIEYNKMLTIKQKLEKIAMERPRNDNNANN